MKRYEALAAQIADMIRTGLLVPGDKAPSIRQASSRFGVSPSTVFQAYYLLESRGLVRARERSGYYVCENVLTQLPQPTPTKPAATRTEVAVADLVFSVLDAAGDSDIAPLGAAFPESGLFPLQKLGQSLARANRGVTSATGSSNLSPGNEVLRGAIARRYMAAGMSVSADEIIITNGAMEGLALALQTLTKPGDIVAIESPGFYAALQIIHLLNLEAIEIPMSPTEGIDLDALQTVLEENTITACWCMTNFQNPLGSTMSPPRKKALVGLLAKHTVPLIEDDVYGELYFGSIYPAPAKIFDSKGLVVLCGSFSKSLAPGYRIGWVLPGRYFESIRRAKLTTSLSASVPAQLGIADFLQRGQYDRHLRKLRIILEDRQTEMTAAIASYFPAGAKVSRPMGGYFLWLELPGGIDSMALYHSAQEEGINFAPGPMFSASGEYRNCLRLNYGVPSDCIQSAVKTLGALAKSQG
ncbi:MAG: DNA-binding transcriptional MocR family regulator [Alcanivorax sp.]|jgi:DNA-binding transcriptional MocR family regulator